MKYSNTDCLGNNLLYNTPATINANIVNNNCLTLNGTTDYIKYASFSVSDIISFKLKLNNLFNDKDFVFIFDGLADSTESSLQLYKNEGFKISFDNVLYNIPNTWDIVSDLKWHSYEIHLSSTNPIEFKIDDISYSVEEAGTREGSTTPTGVIGVGYADLTALEFELTNFAPISICDLKLSNGSEYIYWHPFAEGDGTMLYGAIDESDLYGAFTLELVTSSITEAWSNKQNIFAYNTVEGYGKISGSNAKVPLTYPYVTFTEQYNKIDNGTNMSEAALDLSGSENNIAEFYNTDTIYNLNNDSTDINNDTSIYKKIITNESGTKVGESNYLIYKNKQTDTNLQRIITKEKFN